MPQNSFPPPRISLPDALVAAVIPVLVLFVVPINVIANNRGELGQIDRALTIYGLLALALPLSIVTFLFLRFVGGRAATQTVAWIIRPLSVFLFFTGLILPLTGGTGQMETSQIPINWTNVILATCLSAFVILVLRGNLLKLALLAVVLFVIVSGVAAGGRILAYNDNTPFGRLTTASSTNNIFVVSFDGLSRDVTLELVEQSDQISSDLRDFILFSDVISNAPSTLASLTAEVMGGLDIKKLYGTEKRMLAELDKSKSVTSYLQRSGYEVSIYGPYSSTFSDQDKVVQPWTIATNRAEQIDKIAALFELSMARLVTPPLAFGHDIGRAIGDRYLAMWPSEYGDRDNELALRTRNHKGAEWDIPNVNGVKDYYAYVKGLQVGTERPVAQFMHFLHTHFPVDFDVSCSYRSDDSGWFVNHQNREGFKAETGCALAQFSQFLKKLKELGIYDKSTIVLKSDHGQPISYSDPTKMESFSLGGHVVWGYARYTPLLAIKPAGHRSIAPARDSRPVALSDLAQTLCLVATPTDTCREFEGFNLLSSESIPNDASYVVNLITNPDATFQMDRQESISLKRGEPFFESLTDIFTSNISNGSLACETNIDLKIGKPFNNGLTNNDSWVSWRDGQKAYLKWGKPNCSPTKVRLSLKVDLDSRHISTVPLNFIIGGKKVGARLVQPEELDLPFFVDLPLTPNSSPPHNTMVIVPDLPASVTLEAMEFSG